MSKREYESLKAKAVDYMIKADKAKGKNEKNKFLNQAESILTNLKKELETNRKIALNQIRSIQVI